MQDLPLEYRGTVYSAGGALPDLALCSSCQDVTDWAAAGDPGALTIGNFLKTYNPKLKGQATGTTIPLTKLGGGLNYAVSGARVRDLPGQIKRLSDKLNTAEYASLKDDWKMLVLFIGANDICECKSMTAEQFRTELTAAMQLLHGTFPKTFVSVMTIFNISGEPLAACLLHIEKAPNPFAYMQASGKSTLIESKAQSSHPDRA